MSLRSFAFVRTMAALSAFTVPLPLLAESGDFDDNGCDDLIISACYEDFDAISNAGGVHIIYGRNAGLKSVGDEFWHQNSSGVPGVSETSDYFGWAFAAGDFDADGHDDLAVGVYGEDVDGQPGAGAVHVLYGINNGLASAGDQYFTRATAGVQGTPVASEIFGNALAAGDFDGDGFDDLAIGVPYHDVDGQISAGEVHILYGSSSGLTASGDQVFNQNTAGIGDVAEADDRFGEVLVAGDFDGDGRDDLAISIMLEDLNGVEDCGAVHVMYGGPSGLTSVGDQLWHQDVNGIPGDIDEDDEFGWSLASGDFNNDGRDDLAIGVPEEAIDGENGAGGIHIIFGSSSGLRSAGDQFFSQATPGIPDAPESGDGFGGSLAAGDFDGDGRDDLAIGVPYETIGGLGSTGAFHVLFGSNNGLGAGGDQFFHQNSPGVIGSANGGNYFAQFLQSGDFDGDGRADLAVAAPYETVDGVGPAGTITVLYGSGSGLSTSGDQRWTQNSAGIADSVESGDYLGFSSPGDL